MLWSVVLVCAMCPGRPEAEGMLWSVVLVCATCPGRPEAEGMLWSVVLVCATCPGRPEAEGMNTTAKNMISTTDVHAQCTLPACSCVPCIQGLHLFHQSCAYRCTAFATAAMTCFNTLIALRLRWCFCFALECTMQVELTLPLLTMQGGCPSLLASAGKI
jgi:hypothetical protein